MTLYRSNPMARLAAFLLCLSLTAGTGARPVLASAESSASEEPVTASSFAESEEPMTESSSAEDADGDAVEADEEYYNDDDPLGIDYIDENGELTEGDSSRNGYTEETELTDKLDDLRKDPIFRWHEAQNTDSALLRHAVAQYELVYDQNNEWEDDVISVDVGDAKKREFVEYIGPMCMGDAAVSGILASVTIAQAILESGWGQSGLTKKANNLFGIKAGARNTTWSAYSVWDGSYYQTMTGEQLANGSYVRISAKFRAYHSIQASITDHSAYLANSTKNGKLRYGGLVGCKDYKKAFRIIQAGGYATSHNYADNLIKLVEKYDLTRFDE